MLNMLPKRGRRRWRQRLSLGGRASGGAAAAGISTGCCSKSPFFIFSHFFRPWPPMWRPVKAHPEDEDDEELDSAMMVLNKEWDEVEEDKATTLWNDIKKCCTTVRD